MKENHLLVNGGGGGWKVDVGLLVAEKRMETRDGLSMLVHYVTQGKNNLDTSRLMPQMCN